jgi:hypothetical protein
VFCDGVGACDGAGELAAGSSGAEVVVGDTVLLEAGDSETLVLGGVLALVLGVGRR